MNWWRSPPPRAPETGQSVAEGFHPAEGVLLFEDPATTSKIPALERPAFGRVAAAAHPGDTPRFRSCSGSAAT